MNITTQIEKDFNACQLTSDYEKFVLKYNAIAPDNPYVVKAKSLITKRSKAERLPLDPIIMIILCVIAIAAAVGLFCLAMSFDGEAEYKVYHGEHADYKVKNFNPLIGVASMLGGFVLAGVGIYYLVITIVYLTKKR